MQQMPLKTQPQGNNADALKQRLVAMHKFYFKGLAGYNGMSGALNAASFYKMAIEGHKPYGEDVDFWVAESPKRLCKLKGAYASIPFDQLRSKADFYPLFAAKNALKMAEGKLGEVLAETEPEKIEARIRELEGILCIMRDWGAVYRARINMLFKKIHAIEGNSDFELELIDVNGKSWGKMSRI